MAYSTPVTTFLIKSFMEDWAKIIADQPNNPDCSTGDLELILDFPYINEPKELRGAEEYTVVGKRIEGPEATRRKRKKHH